MIVCLLTKYLITSNSNIHWNNLGLQVLEISLIVIYWKVSQDLI